MRSRAGRVVSGARIYVYPADSSSQATIYRDRLAATAMTQPVVSDDYGQYSFFVAPGYYDLIISATGHLADTMSAVAIGVGAGYDDDYLDKERGETSGTVLNVSWPMGTTSGAGSDFTGGFYDDAGDTSSFSPKESIGENNASYAAHAYCVLGEVPIDSVQIQFIGTSITDAGVRTAPDTASFWFTTADTANIYRETTEKWLGTVDVECVSGDPVACNYGYSKYWDCNNADFTMIGFESVWMANANDSSFNIKVHVHSTAGWTYVAGDVATPPSSYSLVGDHVTETETNSDEPGAWKRANLDVDVSGSESEGIVVEIVSGAVTALLFGYFTVVYQN